MNEALSAGLPVITTKEVGANYDLIRNRQSGIIATDMDDFGSSMLELYDDVNLLASREIRNRGIATHIAKDGMVASGGTDMFLAGAKRTIEIGAKLGVHSWGDGEKGW